MRIIIQLIFLALFGFQTSSYAASALRVSSYDIEDGLSQETILCIFQDRHGFMWFGTEDGLNRFDGQHFKVFKHQPGNPNSLAQNKITAITQDSTGTMWVTTAMGRLHRFERDTELFTRFKSQQFEGSSTSTALLNFNDTQLWVGQSNQIARFNIKTQQFNQLELPSTSRSGTAKSSSPSSEIFTMARDHNGDVWIGTVGNGLFVYLTKQQQFRHYLHERENPTSINSNTIKKVLIDSSNTLWIGTTNGLARYNPKTDDFERFIYDKNNPKSLSGNSVNAIIEDTQQRLWIGTYNGLNAMEPSTRHFTRFNSDYSRKNALTNGLIDTLYVSNDNVLWIGLSANGLNKYNLSAERFNLTKMSSPAQGNASPKNRSQGSSSSGNNVIWALAEDHKDNLWIGAEGGGVSHFNRADNSYRHYQKDENNPNSLSSNRIFSLLESSPGIMWVGTFDAGVNILDTHTNTVTRFAHDPADPHSLSHNMVLTLFKDSHDNLWVGTRNGLSLYDPVNRRFDNFTHDPANPHSISNNLIIDIDQSDSQTLWVATATGGLNEMNIKTKSFRHYYPQQPHSNGEKNQSLTSITPSIDGDLWVTSSVGIYKFSIGSGKFTHLSATKDLVYAVLETEQGHLWFSSNQGLTFLNRRTGQSHHFDAFDGLQSNEFNLGAYLKTRRGELYFGGNAGFNHFYPQDITTQQVPLVVTLTGFKVFNKPVAIDVQGRTKSVDAGMHKNAKYAAPKPYSFTINKAIYLMDTLTLSHQENLVSFSFSSLNNANPNKVQYQYMLQNNDENWIDTDPQALVATYTNLAPGKYTLKIRARHLNAQWRQAYTALPITVLPAPWLSWWAYSFYSLIALSIVGAFLFQRHQKFIAMSRNQKLLANLNQELEIRVAQRTAELSTTLQQLETLQDQLVESKKMASLVSVVNGVAHEINTPMGIITTAVSQLQFDVEYLVEKLSSKNLNRKDLNTFNKNSKSAFGLLNNNTQRVSVMVRKFKALSEQSHFDVKKAFTLKDLLQQVVLAYHQQLLRHNIHLTLDCPAEMLLTTYYNTLLGIIEQLFKNTLLHGYPQSNAGSIKISAQINNGRVLLAYQDYGIGLDPATQGELFDPFYTTKRGSHCTGLGMAIVYTQVNQTLGGTVSYASEPNKGLLVTLDLPVVLANAHHAKMPAIKREAA
ncbi:MAG: hypothetical protein HRT35_20295 [Algicola sp.]|nr:hypothetical protein [Algicola sp.]